MSGISANFDFLRTYDVQLVRLGGLAERYFKEDPNTCLIKLRQFGEVLAQLTAAKSGLLASPEEQQSDLLRRLKFERVVPPEVADLFHQLRISGNRATHGHTGDHAEALSALKIARQLGIWFHRTFGGKTFSAGAFVPPQDPEAATKALHEELARLRQALDETKSDAEKARFATEAEARERLSAEERARQDREERAVWEQLASEAEGAKAQLVAQLQALQAVAAEAPAQAIASIITKADEAASEINIDEASTRTLIDTQLRARGWEVDTQTMRFALGTRPAKGRNMAIAEWPTKSGPADYALFVGTKCIGVVEAKRRNKNVSSHVDQAQRYARGFRFEGGAEPIAESWPDIGEERFYVPFVFSTNGRPYLKQLETESGIWFRDARKPINHRRALTDWPTPDGLKGTLEIDAQSADANLKATPFDFGFPLRPYQKQAIETVENGLSHGRRNMLLAMATGTGKTKLAIAMLYRLLAAKRFRRVCFVVDRNALGTQAAGDYICPDGGTIDEGIAREAFIETIADVTEAGITDLDSLTFDQIQTIFELYATNAIEARLCNDIGANVVTLPADVQDAIRVESQLHDFIYRSVSDALTAARAGLQALTPDRVLGFVTRVYEQAYGILQSLGEAEADK